AADEQHEEGDDPDRADEAELLTDRREHVVGRRERDLPGLPEPETGARDSARTEGVPALYRLAAAPVGVRPRVRPVFDAHAHVTEGLVRDEPADDQEQDRADQIRE